MLVFSLIVFRVLLLQPWLHLNQQTSMLSLPLHPQIFVQNPQLRCLPLLNLREYFLLKRRIYYWEYFREKSSLGVCSHYYYNLTPGGPPLRIPTSTSSLLQLLAQRISAVVSGQTPPTVVTPLPIVPHSASASSLVPAPAQALPDDALLKNFSNTVLWTSYAYYINVCLYFWKVVTP